MASSPNNATKAAKFSNHALAAELLVALPEHKVPLPGSSRGASQTDLFALMRAGEQTVAVAIEGKVDESFGPTVGNWLKNASPGKLERLAYICDLLGLSQPLPNSLRYQLLHRTASAMIEARRFKTDAAAMMHAGDLRRQTLGGLPTVCERHGRIASSPVRISEKPLPINWSLAREVNSGHSD